MVSCQIPAKINNSGRDFFDKNKSNSTIFYDRITFLLSKEQNGAWVD